MCSREPACCWPPLPCPRFAFAEETPKKGGRLTVAADSEPRNLNPAIVASNGVFFLSSKIVEPLAEASFDGEGGLDGTARDILGRIGRRADGDLQAARRRQVA